MIRGIPVQFGEILINQGYIKEETFKECLEVQKIYRKPSLIGEILIEKGYITQEQLSHTLKIQQNCKARLENEYFTHLALKKKLLNGKQIWELRKKYMQQMSEPNAATMISLAVTNNYLSMQTVQDIIKSPEYQQFHTLKSEGKTSLTGYEMVGNVIDLKTATIYKAIQIGLDRVVALKVLLKEHETAANIKNFFAEAQITACFNHPNLIRIYDSGVDNSMYYYAMEFVEGQKLSQRLTDEGRLLAGESVRVIRQIAKALAHIHSYQFIHGEVNPRNIAIRGDGVAKLLDMSSCCSIKKELRSMGKLNKMPQYMAPEQLQAGELMDVRTDIYCMGATFYRMLTGHPPASGKAIEEIKKSILEQEPTPIHEIDHTIPEDLSKIVSRMLRKDPQKRYPEMKNVMFALKKILL